MKPRIGVYLSEQTAARLAAAARRPGATKSALVEAALDRFLGSDDDVDDTTSVARHLNAMSRQIEYLDRDLRTVNETVALHARFHLAVTPVLPAAAQAGAFALGVERFDEFAAQVGRRVHLGTSLMQETMDRVDAARPYPPEGDFGEETPRTQSPVYEPDLGAATSLEKISERSAAVREDGSRSNFPGQTGHPLH
jgi:hypothetical protein